MAERKSIENKKPKKKILMLVLLSLVIVVTVLGINAANKTGRLNLQSGEFATGTMPFTWGDQLVDVEAALPGGILRKRGVWTLYRVGQQALAKHQAALKENLVIKGEAMFLFNETIGLCGMYFATDPAQSRQVLYYLTQSMGPHSGTVRAGKRVISIRWDFKQRLFAMLLDVPSNKPLLLMRHDGLCQYKNNREWHDHTKLENFIRKKLRE